MSALWTFIWDGMLGRAMLEITGNVFIIAITFSNYEIFKYIYQEKSTQHFIGLQYPFVFVVSSIWILYAFQDLTSRFALVKPFEIVPNQIEHYTILSLSLSLSVCVCVCV